MSREGIAALAAKAEAALDRLRTDFPPEPDVEMRAPTPYLGPFNCFGWLALAALHYDAHLVAIERGTKSALWSRDRTPGVEGQSPPPVL